MQKMGWFGWLGHSRSPFESAYDVLFNFNRNYASIMYCFRDIAGYLSKIADYNWCNFAKIFGNRKLDSLCYRVAMSA